MPELRWIGGCHARSSLCTPRAFLDATRTLCLVRCRCYSHVGGRRLLSGLGSAAALGPRGRRRLPAQGPRRRSPSRSGSRYHRATNLGTTTTTPDRGATATARSGQGAPATTTPDRGSTAARALGQPLLWHAPCCASSLMNWDGA
jgi:hypothetical protein